MKKKIYRVLFAIVLVGFLTGCGNNSTSNDNSNDKLEEKISGNCTAVECIKQIEPENTVEEINKIIGIDGELTSEKYNIYYWKISDNTGVKVAYYSSEKGNISIDYDSNSLANDKIDFSKYDELKSKVNSGISYNDFISYIGNVHGTLIEKTSSSMQYVWVSKDGSYLKGTFSNRTGNCTVVTGRIK